MNSETKHTPTPWGLGASLDISSRAVGANHNDIAHVYRGQWSDCEREANAAFIVRASNEHAALCAVAEAAKMLSLFAGPNFEKAFGEDASLLNKALANLAAIRGGAK